MGLTRLAQDPWSESHTVPNYTPPPVEVKSKHVPLTAERAEELVKTHLERNSLSMRISREQMAAMQDDPNSADAAGSLGRAGTSMAGIEHHASMSSLSFGRSGSLTPSSSLARRPSSALNEVGHYDTGPSTLSPIKHTPRISSYTGGGAGVVGAAADAGYDDGAAPRNSPGHRKVLDRALLDAWMRDAGEGQAEEEFAFEKTEGSGSSAVHISPKPPIGQPQLSRRLSCPEVLLHVQDISSSGGEQEPQVVQQDALEPLANHHLWMHNRSRGFDGSGLGLLYSASSVLQREGYGGHGWQPRDAASIFTVPVGGSWDALPNNTSRLAKLRHEGGSTEAVHTLAAVIIQSYCRGWQARRRVARMRAQRQGEESARNNARAAAEALARERAVVRRKLRAAARDCLLAVQAQQDYDRTRVRMAAARGSGSGAAAAPPPPPPSIPEGLWARCKALGQDPIQVLLDSGMLSQQIEEIIAASMLVSQLPRRAAAVAARMGVAMPPPGAGSVDAGRNSLGGASSGGGGKSGSASDDGGAAAAAAAAAATGLVGAPPLARRLSLPGRAPQNPLRSAGGAAAKQPQLLQSMHQVSTAQLVEQLLAQQHQQQHGGPAGGGGLGSAVRRSSGSMMGGMATGPSSSASGGGGFQQPLRRQPSPSRGPLPADARPGLHPGLMPGAHLGGGFAGGMSPMRASQYQLQQMTSLAQQQVSTAGHGGRGASGHLSGPGNGLRGTSRRMSDFVGGSGSGGGGMPGLTPPAAMSFAAVGSSAVTSSQPDLRTPMRARSLGISESGAVIAGTTSPPLAVAPPPPLAPVRVVLPAVTQPAAAAATVAAAAAGSLGSGELKGSGANAGSAVAASVGGLSTSVSAPVQGAAQQQQPPHHLPHHLQAPIASAASSPISRPALGGQSSSGYLSDASPAILRRHSFVDSPGGPGGPLPSGPTSSGSIAVPAPGISTSISVGGAGLVDSINSALGSATSVPALLGRSNGSGSARSLMAASSPNTSMHGGMGAQGGAFPMALPPLLQSQGSWSGQQQGSGGGAGSGASSGTASPALSTPGSANTPHASGVGDALFGRVRRASNLAPSGPSVAVPAASPPPGAPPAAGSPITIRRLQSLTSASSPGAAAAAAAYASSSVSPAAAAAAPVAVAISGSGGSRTTPAVGEASGAVAPALRAALPPSLMRPLVPAPPLPGGPARPAVV